jgi:hypothetical protein
MRLPFLIEQNIGWLDVAMQHAALVRVMHRAGHRRQQLRGPARPLRVPRLAGRVQLAEVAALDEFHAEVMLPLVLPNLVDRHDVRMVEVRRGLRLRPKSLHLRGRGEIAGPDHLERHRTLQTDLARQIHHTHAARRQFALQLIIAEGAPGRPESAAVSP